MTSTERYQRCQQMAALIVAAHRAGVPEGCDPQNTWVAIGVGVAGIAVSSGTAMYQQSQQKKAMAAQNKAMAGSAGGIPPVQFPDMPAYVPADFYRMNSEASRLDRNYYATSDRDFAERRPGVAGAEKAFEAQTLKDQVGDSKFIPQMQQEALTAGLGSSLNAFGDAGPILARGGGAEANVAKNLGLSVLAFQDRNRANAQGSLSLAEQIFPHRNIGLSGKDYAGITLGNLSAQNAWNQANHAATVDELEFNAKLAAGNQSTALQQGNANAQAQAQMSAAQAQMYGQIAQSAVGVAGNAYGRYQASPSASARYPAFQAGTAPNVQTYGGIAGGV